MTIDSFRDDYAFLSNFYKSAMYYNGAIAPTAEHMFQSQKTMNAQEAARVLNAPDPQAAKALGRRVTLRSDWEQVKDHVMYDVVLAKFEQNDSIRTKLLATGSSKLVEGNTWGDTYWGVYRGKGQNKLGNILMQVRAELAT